jgi:hypothetical protein
VTKSPRDRRRSARHRPGRRPGRRALALVAAPVLVLSACSAHPGAAAVVGSDTISESRVDDVALALCSAQSASQTGAAQDLAGRAARQGALAVLINGVLSRQYGDANGLEPDQSQVSAAVDANQATIDKLPASRRTAFSDTLRDYAEGQLVVIAAGQKQLRAAGARSVTQQQALAAGTKLRDAWVKKHVKVKVDPRFGRFTSAGSLAYTSGSLSSPVSTAATAGAKQQPGQTWVSSLPATQKCS